MQRGVRHGPKQWREESSEAGDRPHRVMPAAHSVDLTSALPIGAVTFLFTDVEGSTRLWERERDAMRLALARHDSLIEDLVARHGGAVVRPRGEGDSRFGVFATASNGRNKRT